MQKIKSGLRQTNLIQLSGGSVIHPAAKLKDVVITGQVTIGENTKLTDGVTVLGGSAITIGRFTSINGPGTDIYSRIHPVQIGNFCSIARQVSIQEFNHNFDRVTSYFISGNLFKTDSQRDISSKGPVNIGHDVWIGAQCVILSGVTIGNGAVIGANSVVSGDVPPYAIVSGSPARIIRYRFSDEIIQQLMELKWWDWTEEKIKKHQDFFNQEPSLNSISAVK